VGQSNGKYSAGNHEQDNDLNGSETNAPFDPTLNSIRDDGGNSMDKYECPCGYVYDPAEGDPEHNIAPGTPFEELPDDWVCPKCGAEKEFFEKVA